MARNILLLEPGYKNKYPPLGLMKIAQYHRGFNENDNLVFAKGEDDPKLDSCEWDRIYITTLFSFEWKKTAKCIDKALELVGGKTKKIFVGGIAASLMTEEFQAIERWQGIRFIQGLLDKGPAESLKLRGGEFGWKDNGSTPIEEQVPDYSILDQIDYEYAVNDAYFGYASRGCVRKCSFCGGPKLEGAQRNMPPITGFVHEIASKYGEKKDLILMDNNVTAAPNFNDIMAEIRDLGFGVDAKLERDGRKLKRRVDFNQGVDSRLLAKNPALLREMASICISPLRIAFDHWGVRKPYEQSIRDAAENNITSLSNYMLYNFFDTPEDLYQRLRLNIELNQELGIRIWSFPMRYQPVNLKDRTHVGKNWNKYYLRSFQVILQATHGVVSGNPKFFDMAFGGSEGSFLDLLGLPHEFIYNRKYYFLNGGRPVLDEYLAGRQKLSQSQREELVYWLALAQNSALKGTIRERTESAIDAAIIDKPIRELMRFHAAYSNVSSTQPSPIAHADYFVPEDEKVEDAGLFDLLDA